MDSSSAEKFSNTESTELYGVLPTLNPVKLRVTPYFKKRLRASLHTCTREGYPLDLAAPCGPAL